MTAWRHLSRASRLRDRGARQIRVRGAESVSEAEGTTESASAAADVLQVVVAQTPFPVQSESRSGAGGDRHDAESETSSIRISELAGSDWRVALLLLDCRRRPSRSACDGSR